MTRRLRISPAAKTDIIGIWDYTAREHGLDVADAYVTALDDAMLRVLDFPQIGADCSAERAGYRRMRSGSHLIYYIPFDEGVEVVRILHERMDAPNRLRGDGSVV